MLNLSQNALIVYGIALGVGILVVLSLLFAIMKLRERSQSEKFDSQLQELIAGDSDEDDLTHIDRGRNIKERWILYWQKVGKTSGLARYEEKSNTASRDAIIFWFLITIIISVVFKNPIAGIAISTLGLYLLSVLAKGRYNKQSARIQDQLSGFLFALKANIQANETPVRAMLKVVDQMPDPLREDLIVVKQKLLANATFEESMRSLLEKTTSSELRFLATCLIQAAGTGANIESQLDTIQNILVQRKKAADELAKAIRSVQPAIYLCSVLIPGLFFGTWLISPTAKDFWFHTALSWVAFAMIVALYAVGMWLTRRMIEAIKNL